MKVRGYRGDGTYDGTPEDEEYPTSPLARPGHWEWVEDDSGYDQYEAPRSRRAQRRYPRRRKRFRWLRRLFTLIIGLAVLGAVAVGGLLLVTPSAGNAQALSRGIDVMHHVAYPGPPVPPRFAAALTATEDHRFYTEPGIDPVGVARVLVGAATGRPDPGGATLYQQLAKMLYTPDGSDVFSQTEDVGVGVKLYLDYSHEQILRMYGDVAYFGHGYYGLQAASCGYFGKQPARLSWPQAATLAGLVQAPSLDDPITHYAAGRARESHVLSRLVAVGKLTSAQANAYWAQSLHLVPGGGHCAAH